MNKICLKGDGIILRTVASGDLPLLYELIYGTARPEWKKYDAPYFPLTPTTYEQFLDHWGSDEISGEQPDRLVIEADGQVIGTVSYYWEHEPTRWLEAGIGIYLPEYWSGGYGTRALSLWVDHLFETMPVGRVGITTWSGNPRMMRCAEKAGMQLEGRMRNCRYYDGVYYDSIRMGITRDEWEEQRNHQAQA